jgi:outer membrane protein OmpA-like peptidoglycan-associated protein
MTARLGSILAISMSMPPKQPTSAELMRVPGERVPTWLAALFAILGTTASVFVAQTVLPGDRAIGLAYRALADRLTTGLQDIGAAPPSATAPMPQPAVSVDHPTPAPAAATPAAMPEPEPDSALAGAGADAVMSPAHETSLVSPVSQVSQPPVVVATIASDAASTPAPLTDAAPDAGAEASPEPSPPAGGLAETQAMAAPAAEGPSPPDVVHPAPADTPVNGLGTAGAAETRAVSASVCPPVMEIGFAKGSTKPRTDGLDDTLAQLRAAVAAHPDAILRVEGHADASGPAEYNLILSYRRAVAVAKLLVAAGIARERVVTHAYGETTDGTGAEDPRNRRVLVRVDGLDGCLTASHYAEMN